MIRSRAFLLLAVAWGGVVLGHCLAYLLTDPAAPARHRHLAVTGHGGFGHLASGAVVAGLLGAVIVCVLAARGEADLTWRRTAVALTAVQLPAFALIELAERGFSTSAAMADPAVVVGLVVQVLVAVAAALTLALVARVVHEVATRLRRRRPPHPARVAWRAAGNGPVRHATFLCGARRRAPPLPLAS